MSLTPTVATRSLPASGSLGPGSTWGGAGSACLDWQRNHGQRNETPYSPASHSSAEKGRDPVPLPKFVTTLPPTVRLQHHRSNLGSACASHAAVGAPPTASPPVLPCSRGSRLSRKSHGQASRVRVPFALRFICQRPTSQPGEHTIKAALCQSFGRSETASLHSEPAPDFSACRDFLRVRDVSLWTKTSEEALFVRKLGARKDSSYEAECVYRIPVGGDRGGPPHL